MSFFSVETVAYLEEEAGEYSTGAVLPNEISQAVLGAFQGRYGSFIGRSP